MKIVLLKDIDKLGRMGETRDVASGYGRNYLLAKGLAVLASDPKANQVVRQKKEKTKPLVNKDTVKISHKQRRIDRQLKQNQATKKVILPKEGSNGLRF